MTDHESRAEHERYDEWDAAYVLGSLSPSDRYEYERHLADCPRCREAVAELAGLPGLLAVVPAGEAMQLLQGEVRPGDDPPADLVGRLSERVRRERRRRRVAFVGLGLAAAAAAVTAVVLALPSDPAGPAARTPTVSTALVQTRPSALHAVVDLTSVGWGTRVAMECGYDADPDADPSAPYVKRRYGLYLVDRSGTASEVSSWSAGPGQTVRTDGSSATPVGSVARVELRNLDTGTVLLASTLPGPTG